MNNTYEFLQRNMGNRITPELAQGLYNAFEAIRCDAYKAAFNDAIKAITKHEGQIDVPLQSFVSMEGYSFHVANYATEIEKLIPLEMLHVAEVDLVRDSKLGIDLSHEELLRREKMKQLVLFTVCVEEQPVGYMMVRPFVDHGTQKLIVGELYFFIHPDHRKGWLAIKFVRWIEGVLKTAGAYEFRMGHRAVKDLTPFFKRLGYKPFAVQSAKVL